MEVNCATRKRAPSKTGIAVQSYAERRPNPQRVLFSMPKRDLRICGNTEESLQVMQRAFDIHLEEMHHGGDQGAAEPSA
jgi:hypothetical protein